MEGPANPEAVTPGNMNMEYGCGPSGCLPECGDGAGLSSGLLVETHLFEWSGPGIKDQSTSALDLQPLDPQRWADVLENRCEPDAFMEELLNLLE